MQNKSETLQTQLKLINERLKFIGATEGQQAINIDYLPPLGDNQGYTSLELFLLSFSSCLGSAMLVFLRRMNKTIQSFEIQSTGHRKQEHPTAFSSIHLNIYLKSDDITKDDLDRVLKLSEDTYCPVWSMIKGNVSIETTFVIEPASLE